MCKGIVQISVEVGTHKAIFAVNTFRNGTSDLVDIVHITNQCFFLHIYLEWWNKVNMFKCIFMWNVGLKSYVKMAIGLQAQK